MGFVELVLIAVGLSMDAFAVALCKGLSETKANYKNAAVIAVFFGGFQALMPFIGWLLASRFINYISAYDHWIALILLSFIGGKMLYDAFHEDGQVCENSNSFDIKEVLMLSVATSIDALAVGITFALLPSVNIILSVFLIGIITFVLSFIGGIMGNRLGARLGKKAEIAGGLVLIMIGLKIFIEHTMHP